jgi:hypothetical protein
MPYLKFCILYPGHFFFSVDIHGNKRSYKATRETGYNCISFHYYICHVVLQIILHFGFCYVQVSLELENIFKHDKKKYLYILRNRELQKCEQRMQWCDMWCFLGKGGTYLI